MTQSQDWLDEILALHSKAAIKSATQWWITTDFFTRGGKKVDGPFSRRDKALKERSILEKKSGGRTYAIDSTKRKVKTKTVQHFVKIEEAKTAILKKMEQEKIEAERKVKWELYKMNPQSREQVLLGFASGEQYRLSALRKEASDE